MNNNAYYRARIFLLIDLIKEGDNDNVRFFRNGFFPEGFNEQELVEAHQKKHNFSNDPLTFVELTSFSTFFVMHPENVAGKIVQTSSRNFPLKVKGKLQDVEQVFNMVQKQNTKDNKIRLLQLRARALKLKLELTSLIR